MSTFRALLFRVLLACVLATLTTDAWTQRADGVQKPLDSQLQLESPAVPLSARDRDWLREKHTLAIGVTAPGVPPLDMLHGTEFEGITADVIALMRQQLGVDAEIRVFPDREQALHALEGGRIDLLASTSRADLPRRSLVVSRPYASDQPSLFRRQGDDRRLPADMTGLTVAMPQDYLRDLSTMLHARHPRARFVRYPSRDQAMAALAFGNADLYLGDPLSASLLINRSFFNYVRFERFYSPAPGGFGFGFAMRRDGTPLARIVDAAIASLGQARLDRIAKRWTGESVILPGERVSLDTHEQRWAMRHPVVRVMVNDDFAPIAFFDAGGHFNGVVADLLQLISLRTGLRFKVERAGSFDSLTRSLTADQADLTVLVPSIEREDRLRFTRSFLATSFVLIARTSAPVTADTLADMPGKRVAIAKGHIATERVRARYPKARITETSTGLDALRMVADGKADAAVLSLITARYYIARLYEGKLSVSGMIADDSAPLTFAMRRGDTELQSILNKALQAYAPYELQAIANRWRPNAAMTGQTWRDYRQTIVAIVASAVALMTLFAVWVANLRRQIRQRLRAERALSDQLQFMRTFTDGLPDPVYVRDTEGRLLSFNRRYEAVLGITAHDALGKTAAALPAGLFEAAPDVQACYLRAIAEDKPLRRELAVNLRGEQRWIDHWVQPFRDASGAMKGVVCGWQDITRQRRIIDELMTARSQADQASRAKTTFLATMSHEIRTPMSAVIGTLELALRHARNGVFDYAAIETAHTAANGLLTLISDILDIVRIESGHLSLTPTRAKLRDLAESVARVFEGPARQNGIALALEMDSSLNADVLVDPMRFKQILSNLVSNAVKFTERGFVRIRLGGTPAGLEQMRVSLSVEDSGIGIAEADQRNLFRPFSQVNPSRKTGAQVSGAGLGLAICQSLCEMMGGTLALRSAEGKGTRVDVTLMLNVLPPSHGADTDAGTVIASPIQSHAGSLRVLVVDDHGVNRLLLCQQLAFLGHQAIAAKDGRQALRAWRADPFDIVVTDRHMPGMNGSALARAIRREEAGRALAPCLILGLTADARKDEIADSLAAGMDDCLIKPVGLDDLDKALRARRPGAEDANRTVAELMQMSDGNPEMTRRLIDEMLRANAQDRASLAVLGDALDLPGLAIVAHRLKGAAEILKADALANSCSQLRVACRVPGVSALHVRAAIAAVRTQIDTLDDVLGQLRSTLPVI